LIAYLGLGSNVGDRQGNLMTAAEAVGAQRMSSIYETAPQGEVLDQPDFLNAVVEIETELGPEELLKRCKEIEAEMGRRATLSGREPALHPRLPVLRRTGVPNPPGRPERRR